MLNSRSIWEELITVLRKRQFLTWPYTAVAFICTENNRTVAKIPNNPKIIVIFIDHPSNGWSYDIVTICMYSLCFIDDLYNLLYLNHYLPLCWLTLCCLSLITFSGLAPSGLNLIGPFAYVYMHDNNIHKFDINNTIIYAITHCNPCDFNLMKCFFHITTHFYIGVIE